MVGRIDTDPYRNFRFRLEIDGIAENAFTEVAIGGNLTEEVKYKEGIGSTHRLSGQNNSESVTFKRGLKADTSLADWYKEVVDKGADSNRKNLSIILVDEEGNDKYRWDITEAWPLKLVSSELSSEGNDVIIEEMEITYENMAISTQ